MRFLLFLGCIWTFSLPAASVSDVDKILVEAHARARRIKTAGGYWHLPSYMGPHHVSQYYLGLHWLGRAPGALDTERLRRVLLERQLADGSWQTVKDRNDPRGDLDATVFNYWALKVIGVPADEPVLTKARDYILSRGGLARTTIFMKAFLALFGNGPWNAIPSIPYLAFEEAFPINYRMVAQWVTPVLMPLAYLRKHELVRLPSPRFKLDELRTGRWKPERASGGREWSGDEKLLRKIVGLQQPKGSWGGYTISTLLTLMVLDHAHGDPTVVKRGHAFLEDQFLSDTTPNAYLGRVMDGRYWDTALMLLALHESKGAGPDLAAAESLLVSSQVPNGGFPFGEDFESFPDIDDTSVAVLALVPSGTHSAAVEKAVRWILSMQNDDGGWAAFARNNVERPLLSRLLKPFLDSADLYDDSSPDVTGHVLEALAATGHNVESSESIRRAIRYLRKNQEAESGAWVGRWGINYLYGTAAVVCGAVRAGVSRDADWIRKAVAWVQSRQGADGGFGESTQSYVDKQHAGRGVSTPSQTAWALLALIDGGQARSESSARGVDYLAREFQAKGAWEDSTAVGTGHPTIVYMEYPIYSQTFPLLALGRWSKAMSASREEWPFRNPTVR